MEQPSRLISWSVFLMPFVVLGFALHLGFSQLQEARQEVSIDLSRAQDEARALQERLNARANVKETQPNLQDYWRSDIRAFQADVLARLTEHGLQPARYSTTSDEHWHSLLVEGQASYAKLLAAIEDLESQQPTLFLQELSIRPEGRNLQVPGDFLVQFDARVVGPIMDITN